MTDLLKNFSNIIILKTDLPVGVARYYYYYYYNYYYYYYTIYCYRTLIIYIKKNNDNVANIGIDVSTNIHVIIRIQFKL